MTTPLKTINYKLVLLGDSAVGKSSIALRYAKKQFYEYQESTIGAAFLTQSITLPNHIVKLEIWDTAGQERYHALAPMYYRGASAAIIVYDITNYQSFIRAKSWVKELQRQGQPDVVIVLAGNKFDLANQRQVSYEEAKWYVDDNGMLLLETSAKADQNIADLFKLVAQNLPTPVTTVAQANGVVQPINTDVAANSRSSCC